MAEITTDDKVTIYQTALVEALNVAAAHAGEPDLLAAVDALTGVQAKLIGKIKDRNARRITEKRCNDALGRLIAAEVNARIIAGKAEGSA